MFAPIFLVQVGDENFFNPSIGFKKDFVVFHNHGRTWSWAFARGCDARESGVVLAHWELMCALDETHADLGLVLCNGRGGDFGGRRDDLVDVGGVEVNCHGRSSGQGDDECLFAEGWWGSLVRSTRQGQGQVDVPSVSVLLILVSIVTAVDVIVVVGSVFMEALSVTSRACYDCAKSGNIPHWK